MSDDDDPDSPIDETPGSLTEREKEILKRRFGNDLSVDQSPGEPGKEFKATQDRIREIERTALKKLYDPDRGPDDAD